MEDLRHDIFLKRSFEVLLTDFPFFFAKSLRALARYFSGVGIGPFLHSRKAALFSSTVRRSSSRFQSEAYFSRNAATKSATVKSPFRPARTALTCSSI
jgi:hypothetical protein